MPHRKISISFLSLCSVLFTQDALAIDAEYIDQITCKNWRVQLKEPMDFPSFVSTSPFKKEFKQTKNSDEDEGDYYTDIFKPRLPHKIFNSQILSVTSDGGYGGEWNSTGFSVELKGNFQQTLQLAKTHLKVNQWQTATEYHTDAYGRPLSQQKVYYAIQPYIKAQQARYVRLSQNSKTNIIEFGCRAIEGDIPMFINDMRNN